MAKEKNVATLPVTAPVIAAGVTPTATPAPLPFDANTLAALQAQLEKLTAENASLKAAVVAKSRSAFSWESLPLTDVIRGLAVLYPEKDSGAIALTVYLMGFPVNPNLVDQCIKQGKRWVAVSKLTPEEKAKKKEIFIKYGKQGSAFTEDQKAKLAALIEKVPAKS